MGGARALEEVGGDVRSGKRCGTVEPVWKRGFKEGRDGKKGNERDPG